jgi:hypothetical protein
MPTKNKYGVPGRILTGYIRLYKNNIEVRCVKFNTRWERTRVVSAWMEDLKPIIKKSEFQISYEPIL